MTREEEIKELESALRTVMNPLRDYDLELEAEIMIDDGWHKQIEAEWIPNDVYYSPMNCYVVNGYTCSNCKTKVDKYTNYCSYCGAKMEIEGK